mmetsp:Transcript_39398/g.89809  ORF Transcript_39398/g.89809 Transcript_39398/m.89809 type:complete len:251 (-) Transcript_39398:15-767(-)
MTSCHPNLNSPNSPPSMVRNGRVSQHNARVSQHNAMDHHRTSTSHDTSEQEALFPSPLASRQLPRLALPPKTTGKDTGRSASNEDRHFQRRLSSADMERAEELVRAAFVFPTHSAPNPTLRFPVQFYAIGQCLAHPDCICKCIKTREMAHSQKYNWHELGNRFKLVERTVSETLERSLSSPGTTLSYAATPQVERIRRSKSETLKLRLQYLNNARAAGPPRAGASGSPGHLPAVARRRSSQHRRTPELVL